jgi:2'-5' RNA ligase
MLCLYFIAIVPDEALCKEVTALKNHIAQNYFSKAALKLPPHITLYPPFKWDDKNEDSIINTLHDFNRQIAPFSILLNGFGSFEPRVIFIKPEPCHELEVLRQGLLQHLKSTINLSDPQNDRPFCPHITIASRDLQRQYFYEALNEFGSKKFNAVFDVLNFSLLQHDGKKWDVCKIFPFI